MIDHLSLPVSDLARSRDFYDAVLATLGVGRVSDLEFEGYVAAGYGGSEHEPAFWIGSSTEEAASPAQPDGQHIAFSAPDRAAVVAFHAAALSAGGRDNGAPGIRPHYHEHYYAAFVIDPDGYHMEAVCHAPANSI